MAEKLETEFALLYREKAQSYGEVLKEHDGTKYGVTEQSHRLWKFWLTHELSLPRWFAAAKEIALIMTSSAFSQGCFSTYKSLFTSSQGSP